MHVQGISRDTWPLNPKLHLALGIRGLWPRMERGNYDLGFKVSGCGCEGILLGV